ncbi:hypothetical protein ACM46_09945 [Chryseobacterium angstadtii]|uniref:DUF6922 domain-containing protein n=1 Tax=Chryseobacterium angstadtii TaxID=558151 RepID=A0A0J7IGT1_9FLAO|nr:hypothetical protein [Chryseobacterium angstadtii]KMQ65196.1 hypothetical protein ACM46_09945 [Chryseobacterium angstadtii]
MKRNCANKRIPNLHPKFFWDTNVEMLDWEKAYHSVIARIIERGGQEEIDEIVFFYGYEKVIDTLRNKVYFLPNYAIDRAVRFFPELKKEEMYCYLNRKDKPYHWI